MVKEQTREKLLRELEEMEIQLEEKVNNLEEEVALLRKNVLRKEMLLEELKKLAEDYI